ncbi:NAD(P)H-dependent oxidoreductase [Nocardioides sp. LMS-CY]|uniref:NADPH-dependent FMN reductase n=1 Tax=Nocardioides sp. (strain LMS-CY) TaxID=2840457 RepID=UPI001BFFE685|nr:NAD(P)H-dependent oxidoreductase [Nocardioides sp. LMS-CY]QWF22304.1 NAD(P)H-dependent oxidoreductase [Nocardioides sp. LMS-CY]
MSSQKPVVQVITGSTRRNRVGHHVAEWVASRAGIRGDFAVERLDLAEVDLPLYDEPRHPRLQQYEHEETWAFSRRIERANAHVFVFPEYNHSFNAALKNAIDHLFHEWADKPIGLVSYGGISGGTRAAAALRPVLSSVRAVVVPEAVVVPLVSSRIVAGDAGPSFCPSPESAQALDDMLDGIASWIPRCRLAPGGVAG